MARLSSGLRFAMCTDLRTSFANGVLYLYSGTPPASADQAETGVLLAIITVDAGPFTPGNPANGLNFDAVANNTDNTKTLLSKDTSENWQGTGVAEGTIGYGRFFANDRVMGASTTAVRFDGTASVSGGDFTVSTASVKVGSPVVVSNMNISIPYK